VLEERAVGKLSGRVIQRDGPEVGRVRVWIFVVALSWPWRSGSGVIGEVEGVVGS
jgi:hypothetical protein